MRSPFILSGLMMCLVGFSINISKARIGVKYFGTFFCVVGAYAAIPGAIAWWLFFYIDSLFYPFMPRFCRLGNNLSGQYKRGIGMSIHVGFGNLGGALACNFYRARDSPRFIFGRQSSSFSFGLSRVGLIFGTDTMALAFVAIGLFVLPIIVISYLHINTKRDAAQEAALEGGQPKNSAHELRKMGDRAPDFRYTL